MTSYIRGPPIVPSFLIQQSNAIKTPTFNAMFNHLFLRINVNFGFTVESPAVPYGGSPSKKIYCDIICVIDKLGDRGHWWVSRAFHSNNIIKIFNT